MLMRLGRTTGPVWVCEELNSSPARSRPCSFSTRAATTSVMARGNPMTSVVTMTTRPFFPSSMASAFADSFCNTPVEGLVREA
jgi:hypothetical protein